jgi:hypothetical protein
MRWDDLFADLEAQAAMLAATELDAEVDDQARVEVGRLLLVDRLRAAVGCTVTLRCTGPVTVTGRLLRVGREWALVAESGGREALVALHAVLTARGLGRWAAPEPGDPIDARLGLRRLLRGLVRDRATLRVALVDGSVLDGTLDRVGYDFVELAEHPPGELRRRGQVREVAVIALAALCVLWRDA